MTRDPHELPGDPQLRVLSDALRLQQVGVLHQGTDLIYDYAHNIPSGWPGGDPIGRTDDELLPPHIASLLHRAKTAVMAGGPAETVEVDIENEAENGDRTRQHRFETVVSADRDQAGHFCGLLTTLRNITGRRERELAVTSLMREVSHRSKNLLAIVQSLALQTARHSDTMEAFLHRLRGRLRALANAQDLVTSSNWRGAMFRTLALSELSPRSEPPASMRIAGENILLGPNAALHIGLALHELLNNAERHGALSERREGEVSLSFKSVRAPGLEPVATMDWEETGVGEGPATAPGFGSLVLERIVPAAVDGTGSLTWGKDRLHYALSAPLDKLRH